MDQGEKEPMKTSRTHDLELYLQEDRYENPKEMFKRLYELMEKAGLFQEKALIGDFGCAAGEFLYHLKKQAPQCSYVGVDPVVELLEKAREVIPTVDFKEGSVLDSSLYDADVFDSSLLVGVNSIFDSFNESFGNLIKWTKPGGRVYVADVFNPYPFDVWIKYRQEGKHGPDHREAGWNMFSRASISKFLEENAKVKEFTFHPFEMPFDLDQNQEDLARTWTMKTDANQRLLTNGLSIIVNTDLLEIIL